MIWQLLVAVLVIYWISLRWQSRRLRDFAKKYNNDLPSAPVLGHAWNFIGCNSQIELWNLINRFNGEIHKAGGVTCGWMFNKMYFGVADPPTVEVIMKTCLNKDFAMRLIQKVSGNGSALVDVPIWRPRRKALTPVFRQANLNHFVSIFNKLSVKLADELQGFVGKGSMSIMKNAADYTMATVCETSLGIPDTDGQFYKPFLEALIVVCKLAADRIAKPWLHLESLYRLTPSYHEYNKYANVIIDFVETVIRSKRKELEQADNNNDDDHLKSFLELMIGKAETASGFTDVELREEIMVLVFAGNDVTALCLSFSMCLMARHPDVQDKVYAELQEVFGKSQRPVENADLHRLSYLDAVVKEALRLYPPISVMLRRVDEDVLLPSGETLPQGAGVYLSLFGTHRNTKYWGDDANEFRPERFLDGIVRHPAATLYFGYGPRNCIGYRFAMMTVKTAMATLLRRYRVQTASPDELGKPLNLKFDVFLRDADDFKIVLEPRD